MRNVFVILFIVMVASLYADTSIPDGGIYQAVTGDKSMYLLELEMWCADDRLIAVGIYPDDKEILLMRDSNSNGTIDVGEANFYHYNIDADDGGAMAVVVNDDILITFKNTGGSFWLTIVEVKYCVYIKYEVVLIGELP